MVLRQPKPAEESPLRLEEAATPAPGAGEIRLQVRCCGVCHTDLHIVEGELQLPRLPLIPGHQIVGIVDAVGAGVRSFREGDLAGIPWLHETDGHCAYCRRGQENLCDNGRFTGLHSDGGFADYTLVREDFAYALPAGFGEESTAPLLCAGVIGFRSLRLSGARAGDRLGLYGFGASAHIVLQMARHLGCETYVVTRTPSHQQLARELGAAWVGSSQDGPPELLDAAIIFAPAGALVPEALRHVRKGATVALAGITMSDIPALPYELLYQERVLRSVANSTREDVRECLRVASEAGVRTEVEVFPLEAVNEALAAMKHSRIKGAGVLRVSG